MLTLALIVVLLLIVVWIVWTVGRYRRGEGELQQIARAHIDGRFPWLAWSVVTRQVFVLFAILVGLSVAPWPHVLAEVNALVVWLLGQR
jgi:H+/Cl- antiporter ClcA